MKAIILCAGDGTRLRPLTNVTPKPLVELHGKTILERCMEALPDSVDEVYLVVNPSKVQHFDVFVRTHEFPHTLYLVTQSTEMVGTWSALFSVREFIQPSEKFLVINGDDIFLKEDLEVFVTLPTPACGVFKKISDARYRTCDVDEATATITQFRSQKPEEVGKPLLAFTGLYLLSDEFFEFSPITCKEEFSIPDTVFHYYERVGYYPVSSWHQINTLEDYEAVKGTLEALEGGEDSFEEEI